MIVELELLQYRPRMEAKVAKAYGDAVAAGQAPGTLAGYWTVDVGRLNSAALLWTFDDAAAHDEAVAARAADAAWPPDPDGVVIGSETLVLEPASFNAPLKPGAHGAVYEIRIYDYQPGMIGTVVDRWAPMVGARAALSELTGCFWSSGERADKWVHIWPYPDPNDRVRARGEAARQGIWPPDTGEWLLKQENMMVLPAAFSPLH